MIKCDYGCGVEYKFILKNGKHCCSEKYQQCPSMKEKYSKANKGKKRPDVSLRKQGETPWNKGLTKDNDDRVMSYSIALIGKSKGVASTPELEQIRKDKISKTMKSNGKSGGCRKGSGIGKQGWYNGYWCDSSWELAYVIYNIEHNINFTRCNEVFEYLYEKMTHKYYPDFKEGDYYIEIKGYKNEKWIEKEKQFKKKLILIDKAKIDKYLDFAITKYGKDFTKLYD